MILIQINHVCFKMQVLGLFLLYDIRISSEVMDLITSPTAAKTVWKTVLSLVNTYTDL